MGQTFLDEKAAQLRAVLVPGGARWAEALWVWPQVVPPAQRENLGEA
jgi:putative intracellular protease/amidase